MALTDSAKIISAGNLNSDIPASIFDDSIALAVRELQEAYDRYTLVEKIKSGGVNKGNWNALINTPALADGIGTQYDYYTVSVAGSQDFGDSSDKETFKIGDYAIYDGASWVKILSDEPGDIERAETLLSLSLSIIPLNSRSSVDGGFVSAVGFQDSRNELMSLDESKGLAQEYRNRAFRLLENYINPEDDPTTTADDPEFVVAPGIGFYSI